MLRLRQKVRILSSKKADGRFNYGTIIGVEIKQNNHYLGYMDEKEFLRRFDGTNVVYTVAYVDCVTDRACVQSFSQHEIEKK